ncbi:MAG: ATP-binding cassette domain-containing protein, partial [Ureaplasma sp.]|nr:ATP-binding cassette domain-containing protein [Ureaplasma sp.]
MYYSNHDFIDDSIVDRYIEKFNSREIKNIALMGENGSGKSTILKALQKKQPKKYISINMMEFNYNPKDSNSDQKREIIEKSIVNQLIHQVPSKDIPYSTIKKEYPDKNAVRGYVLVFIVFLLSLIGTISTAVLLENKNSLMSKELN